MVLNINNLNATRAGEAHGGDCDVRARAFCVVVGVVLPRKSTATRSARRLKMSLLLHVRHVRQAHPRSLEPSEPFIL